MYCAICGSESFVELNHTIGRSLCRGCNREFAGTEPKLSFDEFTQKYWVNEDGLYYGDEVPSGVKREFYSEYRLSVENFDEYLVSTSA